MTLVADTRRNIGIMAHIDAGKTTCTERLLFYTHRIHRAGNVDDGNTTTDFDEEERKRGITISAACVSLRWDGHDIRIIDTPGHIDFSVEVERSLRVLDGAVFVLDASQGVECQSEAVWHKAERYGVARLTFVNKMDKVGADFAHCLRDMRERLGARPVALQLPLGSEGEHRGVIDLVRMRALVFEAGEPVALPIPEAECDAATRAHAQLVEACAEVDDDIMAQWIAGESPSEAALVRALRKGSLSNRLHLVLCGSAFRHKGMQPLLDAVVAYLPSPSDRYGACDEDPFSALVFKTIAQKNGTDAFIRIYSGRARAGDTVLAPRTGANERMARLFIVHAQHRVEQSVACAGDIVAVRGLRDVKTGDTLCARGHRITLEPITIPEPVLEVAIETGNAEARDKLGLALSRLLEEDPSLRARFDEETGQTILRGMGELHVEIAQTRLARDAGVTVQLGKPVVAYRETMRAATRVDYKHDKQNGGAGQFARVVLDVAPGARGSGFAFFDETKGGVVPKAFVPAVEKGVRLACLSGMHDGCPLVDVVVRLVDGSYHEKDSSTLAFEIAGAAALREAAEHGGRSRLEPIMRMEIAVPTSHVGDVVGDLGARRGRVVRITPLASGVTSQVDASVPLAELFGYVNALRSMTHGRGSAAMQPEGYELRG